MTNLQAIDLLKGLEQSLDDYCELNDEGKTAFGMAITALELFGNSEQFPSAQPEQHLDEWCVDCKEYDKEKHSCPRWNRVIRQTLLDAQPEHKTGHWIPVTNGRGGHQCDKCGCYAPSYQSGTEWLSNFCPECNADMRGEGVI